MEQKRPNIIIFNPDQMRWDSMGHMGNPAAITPYLDALLQEGVSFENAFCQNPVCTPSRCSFMSGWYPHTRGHRTMQHMMKQDEPVLLKQLKDSGYYVWMQNRNDLIPAQENRFHDIANCIYKTNQLPERHPTGSERKGKDTGHYYSFFRGKIGNGAPVQDQDRLTINGAIDFIQNWNNSEEKRPLCMFIPLMYPHTPYQVEEPFYSYIDRSKLPPRRIMEEHQWKNKPSILKGILKEQHLQTLTETDWDELRAVYLGMCSRVDSMFGEILTALKQADMYDNSTIIFMSDHGDYTGDYGITEKNQNTFEDPLVRVPLLIKPSKEIPVKPGKRKQLVELIDFYETIHEIAGFPLTHTQFGKSLLPLLANEQAEHREAVYAEGGRLEREYYCADVDMEKPLDKTNEYYPRLKQQKKGSPEHTKATMCRTTNYKYIRRLDEKDEFYDLQHDPQERINLIEDPNLKYEILRHKELMLTWYQETCDAPSVAIDQRFNIEMVLSMMGLQISDEEQKNLEKHMKGKVLNSSTFGELFSFIKTYKH